MNTNISVLSLYQPALTDRGVREAECAMMTSVSRTQRWKLEKQGRFPQRRRTGARSHHWLLSELELWLNNPEEYAYVHGCSAISMPLVAIEGKSNAY